MLILFLELIEIYKSQTYNIFTSLNKSFLAAPISTIIILINKLIIAIIPSIQIIVTSKFIDTAIKISKGEISINNSYLPIFYVVVLIAFTWINNELMKFIFINQKNKITQMYNKKVIYKISNLIYEYIEDAKTLELIKRVQDNLSLSLTTSLNQLLDVVGLIIRIIGVGIILINFNAFSVVIIILSSVPLFYFLVKGGKSQYKANVEVSKNKRQADYLSTLLLDKQYANERYLFSYGDKINKTWNENYEYARKVVQKTSRQWFIKSKIGSLSTAIVVILITFSLLKFVINGNITIGLFMTLVTSLLELVYMIAVNFSNIMDELAKNNEFFKEVNLFFKLPEISKSQDKFEDTQVKFNKIEFKNVSFKYPKADNYALKNVSFKIEKGVCSAFVGLNGAGKTTIIRILTGLYADFEGEIFINDRKIQDYSINELKKIMSVVYQDFAKYPITFYENISIGDLKTCNKSDLNFDKVLKSLDLIHVIEKLPDGIDTHLGKLFSEGKDLSGGEWQRVAIARSMISNAPVQILDEPAAALDPINESALYNLFEELSSSKDKATILITHRLASAKIADIIYVMDKGEIVESGSHRELMELNGLYNEMYTSQRSWYQ